MTDTIALRPEGLPNLSFDWHEILQQHERWLRTVIRSRIFEPEAVDDVMQEVALAAVKQAAPIEDREKVAPWLYRLAIRQCLLYRRKCGRQRKLTNRFVERCPEKAAHVEKSEPVSWLIAGERQQMVRDAMKEMSPRDAEILMLKYTENWKYQQIADHLGISHSAVETRLHRARRRMRDKLAAMEPAQ